VQNLILVVGAACPIVNSINIGIIGYGRHAQKLESYFNEVLFCSYRVIDLGRDSQSIRQLIKDGGIDCVFVCSPNYTHWPYLKLVRSASPDVPIYLEKPAVNCPSALSELCSAESMCNVFVGFPLRHGLLGKHGYLAEVLKEHNACPEQTVFSSFIISYPYCLREAYCSSWKSDSTKSPWGVAENLAIHYIDLALLEAIFSHLRLITQTLVSINMTSMRLQILSRVS